MPLMRYTWLSDNRLPIPACRNPFHATGESPDLGMEQNHSRDLTEDDRSRIGELLQKLTGRQQNENRWGPALEAPNLYIALARLSPEGVNYDWHSANRIVGMGSLLLIDQLTGRRARAEDVVVHPTARNQGVAKEIMRRLHALAHDFGCLRVDLTSAPNREAANALYQTLGYEHRETNVYQLKL